MTELEQVQTLIGGAHEAADNLSLAGEHLPAARIQALIQLTRVLWTRLHPPAPAAEAVPPDPPPNGEPPRPRLEAVD